MSHIPAPSIVYPQEEWNDTDFDLPEGVPLNTQSDAESDNEAEDWDLEMNLGKTGGAKASISSSPLASSSRTSSKMITIRPPLPQSSDEDDFDDEGASTIKVSYIPTIRPKTPVRNQDDDMEKAFELPADLTRLSLRPVELRHRQSKGSLEWGDRDHTSSSTSSDAYSTLGFGPSASPSSNSTSAPSIGELDTDDDDDDDGELDGVVLPSGIFDSRHAGKHLAKILEEKKRLPIVNDRVKPRTADSEDDFEIGLIIDDDFDLSPSRLPSNRAQADKKPMFGRSKSAPARPPVQPFRPSSRVGANRSKSPTAPPVSSGIMRVRPLVLSQPTNPRATLSRKSTMPTLNVSLTPGPFQVQSPTSATLRTQKSHQVLKPPSPRSTAMTRKASLSSLIDTAAAAAMPSNSLQSPTTYAAPTAASRARSQAIQAQFHTHSAAQTPYYPVPPTRPTTPSASTAALRLTMPTSSSRAKIRPAISSVFNIGPNKDKDGRNSPNSRPSSTLSSGSSSKSPSSPPLPAGPKILKRPKKARAYGDGTELDGFDDLPADREKEARYRVVPRGVGAPRLGLNRSTDKEKEKAAEAKGTLGRKSGLKRESEPKPAIASITGTLRRKERIEFLSTKPPITESQPRKVSRKKPTPQAPTGVAAGTTRRKPTLIRNLGGVGSPKVVGDMRWNPATLRWEGNENILRDFDAVTSSSTRPALITHLTGSSIGSPVGAGSFAAAGARIVGNMIFDPSRMCWISRLPPEEDEPDPFADMADDEDDWESRGGTIRASAQDQSLATVATRGDTPSPGRPSSGRHSRAMSESGSERGARPALKGLQDVDDKLIEKCREAEERHRAEMKGWKLPPSNDHDSAALFEIRQLATRQY
ncbi:hypothetical protein M422DRAFT_185030 [Sphaerobolus stellatus SS14]|uniref:Protein byr4 n=1 Tax=Sphaerobolus stellatus (strain SS14) TaxID=990650 RepID=A0A0C9TPS4_SPHS4|nr:hypothetical protein M422DRAFT_185030 [Sphaerobolus stellatus SS14]